MKLFQIVLVENTIIHSKLNFAYRWGPNHAADPLVTRVKNGTLQFVAIKRGDTGNFHPKLQ